MNDYEREKEKFYYLNLELNYAILEWNLLKELDSKIDECNLLRENKTILILKESLWYAIIMKVAKITEQEDKSKNNINKILNFYMTNSNIRKKNTITEKIVKDMKNKISQMSKEVNEVGNDIDLIKCWRDKFLAHNDKKQDIIGMQRQYLLTNNKMNKIMNTLSEVFKTLSKEFEICNNDIEISNEIKEIRNQVNYIYNIYINNY